MEYLVSEIIQKRSKMYDVQSKNDIPNFYYAPNFALKPKVGLSILTVGGWKKG